MSYTMTDEQIEALDRNARDAEFVRAAIHGAGFFRRIALRRALRENAAKRLDILNGAA